MKLSILGNAICRSPAFSIEGAVTDCWPVLKEMIRESSPAFYALIKDLNAGQISGASDKIQYSLWKYFNRARFRATPFGSFAAVSMLPVGANDNKASPILHSALNKHHFMSWAEKDSAIHSHPHFFLFNTTCYKVGSEIRYLRHTGVDFELTSVNSFPELDAVLSACRLPLEPSVIYAMLAKDFRLSQHSASVLLRQLAESQLLLNDRMPNITGKDYFARIGAIPANVEGAYIIGERTISGGSLDPRPLRTLPAYIQFLNGFLPERVPGNLDEFAKKFTRKFEGQIIPLAIALDPETGVGYGGMAQNLEEAAWAALLDSIQVAAARDTPSGYTSQHKFLLNALMIGGPICLERYEGQLAVEPPQLPNTFSVIFHYGPGGVPVIEHAGGCTATALLGRFTLENPEMTAEGKNISELEESANPGVLFFDVAYQAEKQVDNVNRRASLYSSELPILTWSCHSSPLCLYDISVTVKNGEVILWSDQHKKRLVPRIASAYNYTRSDLALYRFLCDLQHQGLRSDLSFNLQQFFPGLDYYPRVLYKDLILSPARWRLKEFQPEKLTGWLAENGITFPFTCGSGDQLLRVDPALEEDLQGFAFYFRQNAGKESYISESLHLPMLRDENGKPYAAQYIVNYAHHDRVYAAYTPGKHSIRNKAFFPGDKWLYFEIYCHPSRSNSLLGGPIRQYLALHRKKIQKWFFIRYSDPAPHLRLRVKLKQPADGQQLTAELSALLEPLCRDGLISDIQIRTYFPETVRYGEDRMDRVEDFFYLDSRAALKLLSHAMPDVELYRAALGTMEQLCRLAIPLAANRLRFIQFMADSFGQEFGFGPTAYKSINKSLADLGNGPLPSVLSAGYLSVFQKIAGDQLLLADLFHMHVNRLFPEQQRLREAVLYQYLLKRAKARPAVAVTTP